MLPMNFIPGEEGGLGLLVFVDTHCWGAWDRSLVHRAARGGSSEKRTLKKEKFYNFRRKIKTV